MKPDQRQDKRGDVLRHDYLKRVAMERTCSDRYAESALAKAQRALRPKEGRS